MRRILEGASSMLAAAGALWCVLACATISSPVRGDEPLLGCSCNGCAPCGYSDCDDPSGGGPCPYCDCKAIASAGIYCPLNYYVCKSGVLPPP